jgi:polyphosphate kinase
MALIEREIKLHKEDGGGRLIFKMNALVDPAIIETLYRASQAGVQVDLLVRGVCCLRPGVPKVSENIRVVSIVGRYLEHSRIYYFRNGGKEEILMGSADLMPRNLDNRVEALFPIDDERIRNYVLHDVLDVFLQDNYKARYLQADGTYARATPPEGAPVLDAQAFFATQSAGESADISVPLSALPNKYRKYLSRYGRVDPNE